MNAIEELAEVTKVVTGPDDWMTWIGMIDGRLHQYTFYKPWVKYVKNRLNVHEGWLEALGQASTLVAAALDGLPESEKWGEVVMDVPQRRFRYVIYFGGDEILVYGWDSFGKHRQCSPLTPLVAS